MKRQSIEKKTLSRKTLHAMARVHGSHFALGLLRLHPFSVYALLQRPLPPGVQHHVPGDGGFVRYSGSHAVDGRFQRHRFSRTRFFDT